ncbi:MAG: GGDEF domain-containing protein [Verrucomicrobiia bacterium]
MERVLLELQRELDRSRIGDWLRDDYEIVVSAAERPLDPECELVIIDGPSFKELRAQIRKKREAEEPVMLPFLMLAARRGRRVRDLGRLVDDLVFRPLHEGELKARVANLLRMRRMSQDFKKEHDRVMKLAVTDDVTGFNNTRYLHRYLDRLLGAANAKPVEVCLVFFDLDNFKRLVDAHGHLLGAKALKEVAQVVNRELGEDDRLVRYGGDEFVAILPRQTKAEALEKVTRMQRAIQTTLFLHKEDIDARLTASFGLASYPDDAQDKHELLLRADRCLFRSKDAGKNQVTLAESPLVEIGELVSA